MQSIFFSLSPLPHPFIISPLMTHMIINSKNDHYIFCIFCPILPSKGRHALPPSHHYINSIPLHYKYLALVFVFFYRVFVCCFWLWHCMYVNRWAGGIFLWRGFMFTVTVLYGLLYTIRSFPLRPVCYFCFCYGFYHCFFLLVCLLLQVSCFPGALT
jgi:hypothetical protein